MKKNITTTNLDNVSNNQPVVLLKRIVHPGTPAERPLITAKKVNELKANDNKMAK